MVVPLLIGAGLLGLFLLSKKSGDGISSSPAAAQLPAPQPSFPASVPSVQPAPFVQPASFTPPAQAAPPAPAGAAPSAGQQKARVTTNDPPPNGDLIMRVAPSDSALQVPGGGAEKDGIVTVVNLNASPDGVWSEIIWPGGSRRPGARGFAKKKFLTVLV
jgi:hypothetical protein